MMASAFLRPPALPAEAILLQGDSSQTLQARLIARLVALIVGQRLAPGTRLPGSRELARSLGISRLTVTLVYQELTSRGYLESRPRSGFVVADAAPRLRVTQSQDAARGQAQAQGQAPGPDWADWLRGRSSPRRVIRKPADWRTFPYPFIYGQADPSLFDHVAWRDCARRALGAREFGELAVDMMSSDDPMLVDHICSRTLPRRGIHAHPEEVLITVGSQNALFLALEILARPDRLSVIEEPGYPDFAETLRRLDAPIRTVPVDDRGLDPDSLPEGTRLVVVTPSHNIPTGATMPLDRRTALLDRAVRDDFMIVEDDYDFEMSYLAPPQPALKSLDRDGRVVYLGSFSKSLFPGLRIGYMVAARPLIAAAREARAIMLRHPSTHVQRITAHFLALGHYDAHVARLRQEMRQRREALLSALAPTPFRVVGAAREGGTSLWVSAPGGFDSAALADAARRRGVLIEPGAVFFEQPPQPCALFRMGYGSIDAGRIPEGVARLDEARQAGGA